MEINIYLIVVIAILAGLTILGHHRGFVKTVFATLGLILVLILTAVFNPFIRSFIDNNTDWHKRTENALAKSLVLEEKFDPGISGLTVYDYVNSMDLPDVVQQAILSITKEQESVIDKVGQSTSEITKKTVGLVYEGMADLIIGAITYMIAFCVASLLVLVAGLLFDIASKLPVIRQLNNLLGTIMGFIQGYIVVSLMYVVAVAFGTTNFGMSILEMIDKSSLLSWIYNHNIVVNFVMTLFKG